MIKKILATTIVIAASQASYAYQAEVEYNFSASSLEYDFEDFGGYDVDSNLSVLTGSLFFGQVDDSKGPLAEAAFLDKAGSVSLMYGMGDNEYQFTGGDKNSTDLDGFGASVHGVVGSLILEAEYLASTEEYDADFSGEEKTTVVRVGLGGYMTDRSTIVMSIYSEELKDHEDGFGSFVLRENKGINGALKFFIPFNNGQALSVGGDVRLLSSERNEGDLDGVSIEADLFANYYLTNKLALKLALDTEVFAADSESEFYDTYSSVIQTLSFSSEYFVIDQLAVYGGLSLTTGTEEVETRNFDFETEITGLALNLGVKGRF
ncbi:MAG: hypothetical protein HRU20_09680 [Pseudomonadales bacterium]|nr:hypothetical protein [Pseudomonadales bacterium]